MIQKIYKFISVIILFAFVMFLSSQFNKVFTEENNTYKRTNTASLFGSNVVYKSSVGFHKDNPVFAVKDKTNKYTYILDYSLSTKKFTILFKKMYVRYLSISPDKSKIAYIACDKMPAGTFNKLKVQMGIFNMDTKKIIKEFTTDYGCYNGDGFDIYNGIDGRFNYNEKEGIKWSSESKNVSFMNYDYSVNYNKRTILIYNILNGNIVSFHPDSKKIGNIWDYQIDDSNDSLYISVKANDGYGWPILYQFNYYTNKYTVIKDLSKDKTFSEYTNDASSYSDFVFENISRIDSAGFYFVSTDFGSVQLWRFTKKTGNITLIKNITYYQSTPGISPDGKLFIFYTAPGPHNTTDGTDYLYFIDNINKVLVTYNGYGEHVDDCFFVSENKQFLLAWDGIYIIK